MSSAHGSDSDDSLSPPVLVNNESGADESVDEAAADDDASVAMPVLEAEAETDASNVLKGRDLHAIFRLWEETHSVATPNGFDPVFILTRLSELFEEETDVYMRRDPDPFDERHPSRTDPECELGRMLKLLFRKDHFMTRLVNDYLRDNFFTRQNIQRSSLPLNIAACRLILVIMPGLETSAVFQVEFDSLIHRLYNWAEHSEEPLCSYATGLLAAAMEVQDIAVGFREQNTRLITFMLKRLHELQAKAKQARIDANSSCSSAHIDTASSRARTSFGLSDAASSSTTNTTLAAPTPPSTQSTNAVPTPSNEDIDMPSMDVTSPVSARPFAHLGGGSAPSSPEIRSPTALNGGMSKFKNTINLSTLFQSDTNQSVESKYVRNTIPIHPPTIETSQMLILRYLTSMGEYQEFLGHVFEHNAMLLIFRYIENLEQRDTCLAFEALKYLASLLCHKKFALEFISQGGLERLIHVPRPSIASTGVSIAMYYLAYCEDAMERICSMSQRFVADVVSYALWLLGSTHDSGRCHATMFFGLAFQFKVILDEFDSQDGLRKLSNVISVLPILGVVEHNLNDDEEGAARQLVRHVCVSLKKYMESHLFYKYAQMSRLNTATLNPPNNPGGPMPHFAYRAAKYTPEMVSEQVRTLQELLHYRARWEPVENVMFLNLVTLLLRIIAYSYEWSYSGSPSHRVETVRSALDVLIICCVIPKVHLVFCERMDLPDEASAAGMNIILGAAEGEIVADAEVQKAALAVLVHIVCASIVKPMSVGRYGSARKKSSTKQSEELISRCWESVRSNNGIIVLLQLMEVKMPITDADCIRGMACRALAGLARSETVRQIISKLPLFTNGQLQSLMRDPILQEKRTEHVQFQKYALELMERVSGKTNSGHQMDASLANIHKANVVAHTKIAFNEQQLHELIYEHLVARGLTETATTLQREAELATKVPPTKPIVHHSPFTFRSPITSIASRSRMRHKPSDFNATLNAIEPPVTPSTDTLDDSSIVTPIKLIKKSHTNTTPLNTTPKTAASAQQQQRSLQKQISSADTFIAAVVPRTAQQLEAAAASKSNITLDTIITEYLTNQHALCKNPMSTCPQFDLFLPHKCPDPRPNKVAGHSLNFAGRYLRRQCGSSSRRLDRRLVHSNFCMARTLRVPQDADCFFTSCDFTPCASSLVTGSYSGEVRVFNINECSEEYSFTCHESFVNNVKCNRDGNMVITSCTWRSPLSALWNIENKQFTLKHQWDEEEYMEFSNVSQDRLLGTKEEFATVYDLHTGKKIAAFAPDIFNQYSKNRATFCPSDELILSDGVLWDVRSGKQLHKFDKLNQTLSGVFHPNGLEIVSNTEVWDLRTFHLLRTVPVLDQCQVTFSPQHVMYGITPESESRLEFDGGSSFDSSFKTLDSYDFTSIATIDVKRNIYDLAVNKYGSQIAIVENQGGYDSIQESVVRVYSVGRKKMVEDEVEEDDNDMDMSDDASGSDNESDGFGNRNERSGEARRRLRAAFMNGEENDSTDEWIPVNMSESSGSLDFNEISGDDGNDDDDDDDNMMWVTDSD